MSYQAARDLHVDRVLSGIMIGRKPEGFVADQLVPVLNVAKQSDIYFKTFHKERRMYEAGLTNRAPMTKAREISFTVSSDTYYAKNYELAAGWPAENEVNADEELQWAEQHAGLVTDRLLIDYEMRVAGIADTAANVATVTHVATPWTNHTGTRPLDDLITHCENFRQATGLKPNLMLYPEEIGVHLRQSDQLADKLYGDRGGQVTDVQIAQLINMPKAPLVPSLLINSAGIGATLAGSGTLSPAWGKKLYLFHVNALPGRMIDTWLQAFRWTSPLLGTPWAVQRFPFDPERKKQKLTVGYYQAEKVVSSDLAYAIDSIM